MDNEKGWVSLATEQFGNELYRTDDGGETWTKVEAPSAGALTFLNEDDGVMAVAGLGQSVATSVSVTHDGGATWSEDNTFPAGGLATSVALGQPRAVDGNLLFPVSFVSRGAPSVQLLEWTDESTWTLVASGSTIDTPKSGLGLGLLSSAITRDGQLIGIAAEENVGVLGSGGDAFERFAVSGLDDARGFDFLDGDRGWAMVDNRGDCPDDAFCITGHIQQTEDGGRTWRLITLPFAPTPTPDPLDADSVRAMQLVTETSGWMLTDAALTLMSLEPEPCIGIDCAVINILIPDPRDITPEGVTPSTIRGVHFIDHEHGWLVANRPPPSETQLSVYRTTDSGETWLLSPIGDDQSFYGIASGYPAYFDFINADVGWLVLNTQQTMNTPAGELWHTSDGGVTWEERSIPAGREINFINENDGWVVGGMIYDRLYATHDGGQTWEDASDIRPQAEWAGTPSFGLPTSVEGGDLVLPVTLSIEPGPSLFILFESSDGGKIWPREALAEIGITFGLGIRVKSEVFDDGSAIAFSPDGKGLRYNPDGSGFETFSPAGPSAVFAFDFVDRLRGWAHVDTCGGRQCNYVAPYVVQTDDGGVSWTRVETPDISSTPAP